MVKTQNQTTESPPARSPVLPTCRCRRPAGWRRGSAGSFDTLRKGAAEGKKIISSGMTWVAIFCVDVVLFLLGGFLRGLWPTARQNVCTRSQFKRKFRDKRTRNPAGLSYLSPHTSLKNKTSRADTLFAFFPSSATLVLAVFCPHARSGISNERAPRPSTVALPANPSQASGLGALQSVCFDRPGRDATRGARSYRLPLARALACAHSILFTYYLVVGGS